jgi:hypothetical protein
MDAHKDQNAECKESRRRIPGESLIGNTVTAQEEYFNIKKCADRIYH